MRPFARIVIKALRVPPPRSRVPHAARRGGFLTQAGGAETNHEYYYHAASGEVQWERPALPSAAEVGVEADGAEGAAGGGGGVAEGAASAGRRASRRSVHLMQEPSGEQISAAAAAAAAREVAELQGLVSKLMLGGDLSGGSRADSPALTVSHAITNLAGATMGELKQLQPLPPALEAKWGKELDWLLTPLEKVARMEPGTKTAPDGSTVEVMVPVHVHARELALLRDLHARLTALQARFVPRDLAVEYRPAQRGDGAAQWWAMLPVVPAPPPPALVAGVRECAGVARAALQHARTLNQQALAGMRVPESHCAELPRTAREVLGRDTARLLKRDGPVDAARFIAACGITSALTAADLMSKLQDAALVWERKGGGGTANALQLAAAIRARWPKAPQTRLEVRKISENSDVGLAAIESLSRVIEGRASLILQRLHDIAQAGGFAV